MQKKRIVIIFCAVIGILFLTIILRPKENVSPKVPGENGLWTALQELLEAENLSMKMDIKVDVGETEQDLSTKVYLVKDGDKKYFVVEYEEFPIYVVDNLLLLENGKAFKISQEKIQPEVENETPKNEKKNVLQQIVATYKMFDISCTQKDGETLYAITVTGEQVQKLLSQIVLTEQELVNSIEKLQLTIAMKDKKIQRMELSGAALLNEEKAQLDMVFSEFDVLSEGEYKIPQPVLESVKTIDEDTLFCLTEDLYPLIASSKSFESLDEKDGIVKLRANCGVIQFNTQVQLADLRTGTNEVENSEEVKAMPEWIGVLFLESDISCERNDKQYIYSLKLDEASAQKITKTIVPEIEKYRVSITEGRAVLVIEEKQVVSIELVTKGVIDMFITEVPMEIGAEFLFQ